MSCGSNPAVTGAGGGQRSALMTRNSGVPGRYGVYTYDGDRKVAQVEYEVTP